MDTKKLRILCIPITAAGHLNPVLGFTSVLKNRGHQVIFAIDRSSAGKISKYGFQEVLYDDKEVQSNVDGEEGNKRWLFIVQVMAKGFRQEPIEAIETAAGAYNAILASQKYAHDAIEEIIQKTQPDLILYENLIWSPAIINAQIPVVLMVPSNPLFALEDKRLPPACSGLSIKDSLEKYEEFREKKRQVMKEFRTQFEAFLKSKNAPLPKKDVNLHTSSNLNIYIYPKALANDYLDKCTTAKYWIGIDHALRPSDRDFKVPDELKNKPGRLVYLSMGSLGSSDVPLMKLLVEMLSKAVPKYKFIVSKGMRHNEYELAENMWGEAYVPQLGVLPLVDLAIIHGGNNSFVETVYFGKPMIIIPLMGDQQDNAQRAVDAGIGARFNPFKQSGAELIELMDAVIDNKDFNEKLRKLSKELHESESMQEAADALENVARNPKIPNVLNE